MDKLSIDVNVDKGPTCYYDDGSLKITAEIEASIKSDHFQIELKLNFKYFEENHLDYYFIENIDKLESKNIDDYDIQMLVDKFFDVVEDKIKIAEEHEIKKAIEDAIKSWFEELENEKGGDE